MDAIALARDLLFYRAPRTAQARAMSRIEPSPAIGRVARIVAAPAQAPFSGEALIDQLPCWGSDT